MKSTEHDRDIASIERELANPTKQESIPQSPPWTPTTGIVSAGGDAARRTIANPKTHRA